MKVAMFLLAAGRGSRFGGPVPKAYLSLAGKTLLVHSAERLARTITRDIAAHVVVALHPDDRDVHLAACLPALRRAFENLCDLQIIDGGDSRQDSMRRCMATAKEADFVLVHDAARPLFSTQAARECMLAAARHGAALLAVPAPDTMKRVVDGRVTGTLDRSGVWLAQTPQVIQRSLLVRALAHAETTGFVGTDDVSLVEHLGAAVAVVNGSPTNLKITRPEDLPLAEAILAADLA